jgi:hypothetical protein
VQSSSGVNVEAGTSELKPNGGGQGAMPVDELEVEAEVRGGRGEGARRRSMSSKSRRRYAAARRRCAVSVDEFKVEAEVRDGRGGGVRRLSTSSTEACGGRGGGARRLSTSLTDARGGGGGGVRRRSTSPKSRRTYATAVAEVRGIGRRAPSPGGGTRRQWRRCVATVDEPKVRAELRDSRGGGARRRSSSSRMSVSALPHPLVALSFDEFRSS